MSSNVPKAKVRVLTRDLIGVNGYYIYHSNAHSQSNLTHSFDFHCIINLRKISICCTSHLFAVCYYVNVQFIPRRVIDGSQCGKQNLFGISANDIHLLQFKTQGHLHKRGLLNAGAESVEEKSLKFVLF